jgi:hypothetical protein
MQCKFNKMKLKTAFFGAMLISPAMSAYALDMRSTQVVAPASDAQATATVNPANLNATVREMR